ncbi:hypothetical protein BUALT_Bualt03G0115900 [Buddleja alternifolia]|uniref:Uncharacterized protein n=1 Tax=Buddleja alternifolia TaxID=168488 RepID=A0AAV6Y0A6_9LAMI|nr:hypothetical protein BUALT_Bualt03G0115900 [Buddleja alternifolia]
MKLFDGATELEAVLFGDIAQTIVGLTPIELMKKDEQNEKVDCDAINARLHEASLEQIQPSSIGYDTDANSSTCRGSTATIHPAGRSHS